MRRMPPVTPLTQLGLNDEQLKEHCEHIISHSERYEKERVFEAKTVLDNLKQEKYCRENDPAFQESLYCSADFWEAEEAVCAC